METPILGFIVSEGEFESKINGNSGMVFDLHCVATPAMMIVETFRLKSGSPWQYHFPSKIVRNLNRLLTAGSSFF